MEKWISILMVVLVLFLWGLIFGCFVIYKSNKNNEKTKVKQKEVGTKWVILLLLAIFLGDLGLHRFYAGKIGTGILYLFTLGLFGIGWLIDIFLIVLGQFKDINGKVYERP